MDFAKIKKYPKQISTAFKRFPLASALAVLSTIAFFIVYECIDTPNELSSRFVFWLTIYPIAAMFIALDTSLVQESLKSTSSKPQAIAGATWFVISWLLALYPTAFGGDEFNHVIGAVVFTYTTAVLGLFVAPFFRQKNENAFWNHLTKTLKSFIVATIVAGLLLLATELLLLGFIGLFGVEDPSEKPFFYLSIFCTCTVLPLLFFSTLPTIKESLKTPPAMSKFAASICKFLFIPVFSLSIALFYGYIFKFFIQLEMPYEIVIWLVFAFVIYLLVLNVAMYPARLSPKPTLVKKLLGIFPVATVPLLILMTFSIFQTLPKSIDEDEIYLIAINIFFYVAIAILLIDKIKCKFKYMAAAFCAMLLVVTVGPLRATNIVRHIWTSDIKAILVEEGFSNFPLQQDDCDSLIDRLAKKDFAKAARTVEHMQELSQRDKEFAQYVNATQIRIPHASDKIVIENILEAQIDLSDTKIFEVPKGSSKVYRVAQSLNDDKVEYQNDTLFFEITPKTSDKTYRFAVSKQALEDSTTTFIEGQGAQIRLQELRVSIGRTDNEESKYLWIEGYMFME